MAKCSYCNKEVELPFKCNYCGRLFCEDHRLPPSHECECIHLWYEKAPPSGITWSYGKGYIRTERGLSAPYTPLKTDQPEKIWKYGGSPVKPTKEEKEIMEKRLKEARKPTKTRKSLKLITLLLTLFVIGVLIYNYYSSENPFFGKISTSSLKNKITPQNFTPTPPAKLATSTPTPIQRSHLEPIFSEDYYVKAKEWIKEKYGNWKCVGSKVYCLSEFLKKIKLPPYQEGIYDCSEASAQLEWILEGGGFKAYIADSNYFCTPLKIGCEAHSWVIVEVGGGDKVAIEATLLCSGENYNPPGIIEKPDGKYREYSTYYLDYKEYLRTHPPIDTSFQKTLKTMLITF